MHIRYSHFSITQRTAVHPESTIIILFVMFKFHKLCRLNVPVSSTLTGPRSIVSKQSRSMHCRKVVVNEFGDPSKVARLVEDTLPDQPEDEQVE